MRTCPNSPGVMLKKPASAWAGMPDRPIHDYFGVDYKLGGGEGEVPPLATTEM